MNIIFRNKQNAVLKFEKGERYPAAFMDFLEKNKIRGGFFTGLGAGTNPEISFYDMDKKKYLTKRLKGDFEVLNVTGNISKSGKDTVVHQHVTLGKRDFKALGGHLMNMIIGGTLEIHLSFTPPLRRLKDSATGLNLLEV